MDTPTVGSEPRERTTVLIAGGGPAAIEGALALRANAETGLRVELITPEPAWAYRPLSVLEPFETGRPRAYGPEILAGHGVGVRRDAIATVHPARREVRTTAGAALTYDALLVATGTGYAPAFPHAVSATDTNALHALVEQVGNGEHRRIAFVASERARWTLPLYELALQLAHRVRERGLPGIEISLVTHEYRPLQVFGSRAGELAERLLAQAEIRLVTAATARLPDPRRLVARPGEPYLEVDRVVAMPVPAGRGLTGLPTVGDGFHPVDAEGRVVGVEAVYAAGDVTDHPLKQGGLATQQADAAAAAILADAGLGEPAEPDPPVLRGVLFDGPRSWYLRRDPGDPRGAVSSRALWWPPTKIAGRYVSALFDGFDADTGRFREERRREAAQHPAGARRLAVIGRA